jgi:myo-inositol-1(or 4)-monophosphatase
MRVRTTAWWVRGQPVHTGMGGLVVAADEQTHATLLTFIENQRTESD